MSCTMNSSRLERCYASPNGSSSGYEFSNNKNPPPPKLLVRVPNYNKSGNPLETVVSPTMLIPMPIPKPMPIITPLDNNGHSESATWSHGTSINSYLDTKSSSLLDSHDRFKPEKLQRRPVQKMKWSQSRWSRSLAGDLFSCSHPNVGNGISNGEYPNNFAPITVQNLPVESESRVSSMTIADVSPRIAVKKVLLLYEHAQYREAASFIHRISVGTFRIILRELPMDIFVEAMPHSLPIIEALYAKVFTSDGPNVSLAPLRPESVVMHMVKFFAREEMNRNRKEVLGTFTSGCKKILHVIVVAEPKIMRTLLLRRKALDKAVEGMGQHGLVGTTDESLLPLHDALKLEFRRVVDTYKGALQKLEDLALSNKNNPKSVAHGPAPIQASHQRQLSLRAEEIQDRLIKNKSLLNVVEPTLDNHCLDILLGILQRRIECDKDALFQFTQLRKEAGDITPESVVAPLLMRYSRGCKQILEMMREVALETGGRLEDYEDDSSDLSGYHSDSDSFELIMTSGNSPYVSPRARYNFISRSVRSKAILRPSLLSSSGVSSSDSRSGSSGSSRNPDFSHSTTISNTPTRPRHVKLKNQLYKNNSLVSTSSSGGSESGESVRGEEFRQEPVEHGCVDCVTVVSVPDNQVIAQGVNHRCGISPPKLPTGASMIRDGNERLIGELRAEINQLRRGLQSANATINHFQEREKTMLLSTPRLDESGLVMGKCGQLLHTKVKEERRSQWIREYGSLYAQARVETMDALDAIPDLTNADELKSKLLFSVVVLAFRTVQTHLADIKRQVRHVLQMEISSKRAVPLPPIPSNSLQHQSQSHPQVQFQQQLNNKINNHLSVSEDRFLHPLQAKALEAIGDYLQSSGQKFDLTKAIEQVASQLWTTLYDYPCLKKCDGLMNYIRTCVNVAWGLSNQTPICVLEYETRVFMREMHVRFHSADQSSDTIRTYLWPALLEGPNGPCIHKGVVIT